MQFGIDFEKFDEMSDKACEKKINSSIVCLAYLSHRYPKTTTMPTLAKLASVSEAQINKMINHTELFPFVDKVRIAGNAFQIRLKADKVDEIQEILSKVE